MAAYLSRFKGALLGTFVGDALGMPVENWQSGRIRRRFGTLDELRSASPWLRAYAFIYGALKHPLGTRLSLPLRAGTYTDDTQMMICVAESLIQCGGFDGADMAARFVADYDPRRGYGPGTARVIGLLRRGVQWDKAAGRLFGGKGSYGNGAAMRVAPIALLYAGDKLDLREAAENSAAITHSHELGKEGAALLAYAIALALDSEQPIDTSQFVAQLAAYCRQDAFGAKLDEIRRMLERHPGTEEVVQTLGNETSAIGSIPAAIYSVLRSPGSFRSAVVYAVSLGGDTDTIAAMTGAIAGALHGIEAIPSDWLIKLENGTKGRDYVAGLAESLWRFAMA